MERTERNGPEEVPGRVFKAGEIVLTGLKEAAQILGVHPNTVRRWANEGLVPVIKLPSGVRRFPIDGLMRLRDQTYEGAQADIEEVGSAPEE